MAKGKPIKEIKDAVYRKDVMTPEELRQFYEKGSGRTEVTDSPIDWGLLSVVGFGQPLIKIGKRLMAQEGAASVVGIYPAVAGGALEMMPVIRGIAKTFNIQTENNNIEEYRKRIEAEDQQNPFKSVKPIFANGGTVMKNKNIPVELEGGEFFQTPEGQIGEVQGQSHEQGGVDMALPEGTQVFSDRVKIKGKTMAERKEARMNKMMKLLEKVSANPNAIAKNSFKRTMKAVAMEEEIDLAFQNALSNEGQSYATGTGRMGIIGNPPYKEIMDLITGVPESATESATKFAIKPFNPTVAKDINIPGIDLTQDLANPEMAQMRHQILAPAAPETDPLGLTAGDVVGMAGQAFGAISQIANTISNAKATKKNINHYLGFNEKALQSNAEELDNLNMSKANAVRALGRELAIGRNTARARTRGSATSINSLRNLDLATEIAANEANIAGANQIEQNYLGARGANIGQRTQLLSQKDAMEMQGAAAADLADRQDLDAIYTNFGANFADISTGIQNFGKNLNESKYRDLFLKILPQANKYGIGMDAQGNLTAPSYTQPSTPVSQAPAFDPLFDPEQYNPFTKKRTLNPFIG